MIRNTAVAALIAAGVVGFAGIPAQAAPAALADSSLQADDGGSAVAPDDDEVTIDESGISTLSTKKVGGGTWSYGTSADGVYKRCYSNYKHNSKHHSSAAVIAGKSVTRYADAGLWSRAHATAGWAYTCHTYWNTY
jgi:lactococcin 972 family bacteriocin